MLYFGVRLKVLIASMFAVFPFMYLYTYIQSLQGVSVFTSEVPVIYRALKDIVFLLALGRVVADQFLRWGGRFSLPSTDLLVLLFLLDTLATSMISLVSGQSLLVAALGIRNTSFPIIAYFLSALYFAAYEDYRRFARVMFWTGTMVALLGIVQSLAISVGMAATAYGTAGERSFYVRVFSTMNDPNMYGMYLASCLLLARKNLLRLTRVWRLGGVAILAIGLLLSLSFSVLIPMLALLGLYILTRSFQRPKLALGGLVLLMAVLFFPGVADRFLEVGTLTDVSLQLKFVQMQKALDVFLAHPVIGSGYGLVGQSRTWAESEFETDSIAGENYYLILAAQSGIVGLGLLAAALGLWWWERGRIQRAMRDRGMRAFIQGVTAIAFVFFVANLVTDHYEGFPNNFFVWFLMGAVTVAGHASSPRVLSGAAPRESEAIEGAAG
jgi:hypothetical protein